MNATVSNKPSEVFCIVAATDGSEFLPGRIWASNFEFPRNPLKLESMMFDSYSCNYMLLLLLLLLPLRLTAVSGARAARQRALERLHEKGGGSRSGDLSSRFDTVGMC